MKTYDFLNNLTIDELNEVINVSNRLIRKQEFENRTKRENDSRKNLSIGDIVRVKSKKRDRFFNELWEVLKLNPKYVKCQRENGEIWNIPYCNIIME